MGHSEVNLTLESPEERLRQALGLPLSHSPFPWQQALLKKFMAGELPEALNIPTGLGKTAVMAIWLVARAFGAPVPRRLIYVVDRRAVVDQASAEAERLREWIGAHPPLQQALSLATHQPLPIATLRGQFLDNRRWLEDPAASVIVVGTVDLIGSRLLFCGYGISRKMRPFHAGLIGIDALVVLDEAHLVPPFERLIEQVAAGRDAAGRSLLPEEPLRSLVPPFRCMSLSATGRQRSKNNVLQLGWNDRQHPDVLRRLTAYKRLVVRGAVEEKDLPQVLAREALALGNRENEPPARVLVFCDSRDHAQQVEETLLKLAPASSLQTNLFVGGRRVYERQEAAALLEKWGFIAGSSSRPEKPTFVIATSAGEVGVDLDADHAVCDVVAWERMVQRFGRVNRRGMGRAELVAIPTARDRKADEAVQKYHRWKASLGEAQTAATDGDEFPYDPEGESDGGTKAKKIKEEDRWLAESTLRREASRLLLEQLTPLDGGGDVSPEGLTALQDRASTALLDLAKTPPALHPPLTRAVLESWSMTALDDHTGRPEVAPWLRGWPEDADEPQTTVIWRKHLPLNLARTGVIDKASLKAFRDAADPHLAEKLETESWRVFDWLVARLKASPHEAGSKEPTSQETSSREGHSPVVALLFDERNDLVTALTRADLAKKPKWKEQLQGALLMVDVSLGGLKHGLLDEDFSEAAVDITEQLPAPGERRVVPFRISRSEEHPELPDNGWRFERVLPLRNQEGEPNEWLIVQSSTDGLAETEEGRAGAQRAQRLDEHAAWARAQAEALAGRLGLPTQYGQLLALAAQLHDEGKRSSRWQRAFHAPDDSAPYAKTRGRPDLNILGRYRHELGSMPYAEDHPAVRELPEDLRELCLHLIAAHHGNARPTLAIDDADEPPSKLRRRAQEIALRFTKLERRWGPWGLAWWETLLRAADQEASRCNDSQGGQNG